MKVFLSWSGEKSREVARKLRDWLVDVIQSVDPWMSDADIEAGARWNNDIERELSETSFGVVCLTATNLYAPWILFETGALAKTVDNTFVCPYLIGLEPADIPAGPLTKFQFKKSDEAGTWDLVCTINRAMKDKALPEDRLRRSFDRCWADLRDVLDSLPEEAEVAEPQRSVENMLEEVVGIVRGLSQRTLDSHSLLYLLQRHPAKFVHSQRTDDRNFLAHWLSDSQSKNSFDRICDYVPASEVRETPMDADNGDEVVDEEEDPNTEVAS